MKNLDVNVGVQSIYFVMAENGVYRKDDRSLACFDFGHWTVRGARQRLDAIDEEIFDDAQVCHCFGVF